MSLKLSYSDIDNQIDELKSLLAASKVDLSDKEIQYKQAKTVVSNIAKNLADLIRIKSTFQKIASRK